MNRPLIINFKNYEEISGEATLELSKIAEKVSHETSCEIVLAPPIASLALVCRSVAIPVIAQHVDAASLGASTGFCVPKITKSFGAAGSLLNHSEHRIEQGAIEDLIGQMGELGMSSIVCARTPEEVRHISRLNPDFIAIEPPELIGSGKAVSKENPKIISDSVDAARGSKSKVICGAGITDKSDVARAIELGSRGILVASGVIKARSWRDKILELAQGMA